MDVRQVVLAELQKGRSLVAICKDEGMPSRETIRLWQRDDAEFDLAVTHAREDGYQARAERALEEAAAATDAAIGRLKFDAERWYLGKLSNAFSDSKKQEVEHSGKVVTAVEFRVVDGNSD